MTTVPLLTTVRARLASHALSVYLVSIAVAGLALLVVVCTTQDFHAVREDPVTLALLVCFVIAGELLPIKLPGHDGEVATSTSFTLALLVTFGPAPAIAAQAAASLIGDVRLAKSVRAAAFNVGQYTLSLGLAALTVAALTGASDPDADAIHGAGAPAALLCAGAVFYAANNLLAGTASALAEGTPIRAFLMQDMRFQLSTALLLLGFAPLVVATSDDGALIMLLLAVPLLAIFRAGKEARLNEYHALHDRLTDLPNRVLFAQRAEAAIADARRTGRHGAVLLMDLDRFKDINDTLGHHRGDVLLRHVGPRLLDRLRQQDVVARFGGDEFAVLLHSIDGRADAERVARRMLESLRRSFEVDEIALDIDASIGIACFPRDGEGIDTLLRRADAAMYSAKEQHSGVMHYHAERDDRGVDQLALVTELRQALDDEAFVLHYQPQIDLTTGAIASAEALVRWQHPTRGLLPPAAFLPALEQTALLQPFTAYVLERAIRQCAAWRTRGIESAISANVSPRDLLGEGLPERIERLLHASGLPPSALELEITESAIMTDPERATRALERLRAMGVRVAIDDFGTGYSSLAYLKRLPIDVLKIDKSFVLGMAADASDAMIVTSTINLAKGFELEVVAEGVEDQTSLAQLAERGSDRAQGFHISRPLPPEQFERWALDRQVSLAA